MSEPKSTALFFRPRIAPMWTDTWMVRHGGSFYVYFLTRSTDGERVRLGSGVGLAVSPDGVHWEDRGEVIAATDDVLWIGSGAVWRADDEAGERFVMNFSEWRGSPEEGRQTIFFAESRDLVSWTRLDAGLEFTQDARWYQPRGRWDCISALPRQDGGYYGYWTAEAKGVAGLGFGESLDGVTWRALPPAALSGIEFSGDLTWPDYLEVGDVHGWNGRYYALVSPWDAPPGSAMNVLVGDSPSGPFAPAAKNRELLVGNTSYFTRFLDLQDEILVDHTSWISGRDVDGTERDELSVMFVAPLKRAAWDDEGTLRLAWWDGNERAKAERIDVDPLEAGEDAGPAFSSTRLDPDRTLILEGMLTVPEDPGAAATGIYLDGADGAGIAFLVREGGAVDYGAIRWDGSGFELERRVDREIGWTGSVRFRLVRHERMTELYLEDVLMQCFCLPNKGSGRIGFLGDPAGFGELTAWYCR